MFSKASDHEKFTSYFVELYLHNHVPKKPCYYETPTFHPRVSRNGPMSRNFPFFEDLEIFFFKFKLNRIAESYSLSNGFFWIFSVFIYPFGLGTVRSITGQSVPDWLKMTSPRTSKPNRGGLSRFWFETFEQ